MTFSEFPIAKVEGLTFYQGNYAALQDVSFELYPGTCNAIVGPNGAGKSTLVKAVLNLIPRQAGRVEIFGRTLEKLGPLRHRLGYIPQNFTFDRSFPISVQELVALGWAETGRSRSRKSWFWQKNPQQTAAVKVALERVGAYHVRHQPIGTLSGGELKRVLLAYCLVIPRQFLVLDEAFAGVDAQGMVDFYHLLDELKQEEGWTVLQVSHDIDMVGRHCDRVLCLNQRLICMGTPETALSPQNLWATYGPTFSRYQHDH